MSGYTEVFQVMLAMSLVSIMVLNANRLIHTNNIILVEGHLEEQIVAYAQDVIEEARALSFDEKTRPDSDGNSTVPVYIPEGFSTTGPDGETSRKEFNDFDDFDGWSATVDINDITYLVSASVDYVETSDFENYTETAAGTKSSLKRITVSLETSFLKEYTSMDERVYSFGFIRSYYAD